MFSTMTLSNVPHAEAFLILVRGHEPHSVELGKRYRKETKQIRFEYVLRTQSTSSFPNSYTMEAQAIINEEARFTVLEMHRYEMDSLLATFAEEGLRFVGGRKYGYQEKRLICLFAKE